MEAFKFKVQISVKRKRKLSNINIFDKFNKYPEGMSIWVEKEPIWDVANKVLSSRKSNIFGNSNSRNFKSFS